MTVTETNKITHFVPYVSTAEAFLFFNRDFKKFRADNPNKSAKVFLRNGPKDKTSMLLPRETLCLIITANVANYLSGYTWVPGYVAGEQGRLLPEDIAHDGAIQCTDGPRKGTIMRIEQVMATMVAHDATPDDIESAVIRAVNRKSARDDDYVKGTALIVFMDYDGQLKDLRQLAKDVSHSKYKAIYLIGLTSQGFNDFVCAILKSPGDTPGTISVQFNRLDGVANVERLREKPA